MNQDQRAALERLLEYVGRGFCAVQADCKVLREFLANQIALAKLRDEFMAAVEAAPITKKRPSVARISDRSTGSRALIQGKREPGARPSVTYLAGNSAAAKKATKRPKPKTRKR